MKNQFIPTLPVLSDLVGKVDEIRISFPRDAGNGATLACSASRAKSMLDLEVHLLLEETDKRLRSREKDRAAYMVELWIGQG